jgi:hypothetical protein
MRRIRIIIIVVFLLLAGAVGCTKRFIIKPPMPSSITYEQPHSDETLLGVTDSRPEENAKVSSGTLSAVLDGLEGNEASFFGQQIERELKARGENLRFSGGAGAPVRLDIKTLRIRNKRTSGFSPYWTYTTFSADLHDGAESLRVTSYFKNGKVPVWTFNEVTDPTYNTPISIVVKEAATKISNRIFGSHASAEEVERIAAEIAAAPLKTAYLKVYELGYTNSPYAKPHVLRLLAHDNAMIRAAAISSLGMLRATDQLDLLKQIYRDREKLEKQMALKSIGDMDTPESRAFIEDVAASDSYEKEVIREVVDLYR